MYLFVCVCVCVCVCVIFKDRTGVLYQDLKHEAIAECFKSDKARTAIF